MKTNEKIQGRMRSIPQQLTAILLLWVMLTVVFLPSIFSAETNKTPEGMVYCPLSKKFQPINPPKEKKKFKPFGDICASDDTKEFLFRKIIIENPFRRISLDENKLTDLALDFLARGESALKHLPNLPNLPSENLIRQIGAIIFVNNNYEHHFDLIKPAQFSSSKQLARPPTALIHILSINNSVHQSAELSRRIAPRAPPVRS